MNIITKVMTPVKGHHSEVRIRRILSLLPIIYGDTHIIGLFLIVWFNDCVSGLIVNPIIMKLDPVLYYI